MLLKKKKKSFPKKKSFSFAKGTSSLAKTASIAARMLELELTLSMGKLFLLEKAKTLALGSLVKALDKPLVPSLALVSRKAPIR